MAVESPATAGIRRFAGRLRPAGAVRASNQASAAIRVAVDTAAAFRARDEALGWLVALEVPGTPAALGAGVGQGHVKKTMSDA